jgi:hypothetical protein
MLHAPEFSTNRVKYDGVYPQFFHSFCEKNNDDFDVL